MNKVILIGGNHHNGLGLARSFGLNGIKPFGIIVNNNKNNCFIAHSKYWAEKWIIDHNEKIIDILLSNFTHENHKPVIIPWSDSAASIIDNNLDILKPFFILPSLGGKQGAIVELMDKQKQVEFMKKYDLPMAKSWTINLPYEHHNDLIFPCICKPVSSYDGSKLDIRKICTEEELISYLTILENKGYNRILIQEFISFERELEFIGGCDSNPSYLISHNIREWPVVGGTNSFFRIVNDQNIYKVCMGLLSSLQNEGYFGMFDIELFQVKEKILINEINWRNSGNSFFALGTNVHWAVIWYLQAIGKDASFLMHTTKDVNQMAMNEATDLRHVLFNSLPLSSWLKDLRRTKSFALWYYKDLKPTLIQYIYLVKELIFHHRKG